jgi:hypothetical protein
MKWDLENFPGKVHMVRNTSFPKKKEQICAAPENFDSYMSMPWDPSDEP